MFSKSEITQISLNHFIRTIRVYLERLDPRCKIVAAER